MYREWEEDIEAIKICAGGESVISIPAGKVEVRLKLIDATAADATGHIVGDYTWIVKSDYVPAVPRPAGLCSIEFTCRGETMSGDCIYGSSNDHGMVWQGMGQLHGFDLEDAFDLDLNL
jgi:hypothetical protein